MPAQSEAHIRARRESLWRTQVMKAEEDILTELRHPRCTTLAVNDDRKARWEAAKRLVLLDRVDVIVPAGRRPTLRPPPGGTERRTRMEMRIKLKKGER
jgi:hypothetical protein